MYEREEQYVHLCFWIYEVGVILRFYDVKIKFFCPFVL